MALQHIFTSAPQGLRQGTRGFTTVAASPQLTTTLTSRLESLSGYDQAFGLSDAKAHLNPVNFAHVRLSMANDSWTIVSRVAAAGVDYSGRSNTLAHHLVLTAGERPTAGPAWLAIDSGVLRKGWSSAPQQLAPVVLPDESVETRSCSTWASIAGDAGWAGVLAWQFLEQPKRPVFLIYSPEQGESIPRMIVEASLLLPVSRRWEVTFSTYAPNLSPDITCLWRGVLAGTPAAAAAKVARNAFVIDFTTALAPPVSSPGVDAARNGVAIQIKLRAAKLADAKVESLAPTEASPASTAGNGHPENDDYDLNLSDSERTPTPRRPSQERQPEVAHGASFKIWITVSVVVLAMLLGLVGYFFTQWGDRSGPTTNKPTKPIVSETTTRMAGSSGGIRAATQPKKPNTQSVNGAEGQPKTTPAEETNTKPIQGVVERHPSADNPAEAILKIGGTDGHQAAEAPAPNVKSIGVSENPQPKIVKPPANAPDNNGHPPQIASASGATPAPGQPPNSPPTVSSEKKRPLTLWFNKAALAIDRDSFIDKFQPLSIKPVSSSQDEIKWEINDFPSDIRHLSVIAIVREDNEGLTDPFAETENTSPSETARTNLIFKALDKNNRRDVLTVSASWMSNDQDCSKLAIHLKIAANLPKEFISKEEFLRKLRIVLRAQGASENSYGVIDMNEVKATWVLHPDFTRRSESINIDIGPHLRPTFPFDDNHQLYKDLASKKLRCDKINAIPSDNPSRFSLQFARDKVTSIQLTKIGSREISNPWTIEVIGIKGRLAFWGDAVELAKKLDSLNKRILKIELKDKELTTYNLDQEKFNNNQEYQQKLSSLKASAAPYILVDECNVPVAEVSINVKTTPFEKFKTKEQIKEEDDNHKAEEPAKANPPKAKDETKKK